MGRKKKETLPKYKKNGPEDPNAKKLKSKPKGKTAPHEPTDTTRATVKKFAAIGIPGDLIAKYLGINKTTLFKYYQKEMELAHLEANANVAGALYKNCMNGNVTAQIFWSKTRLGWRETGPDSYDNTRGQVVINFTDQQTPDKKRNDVD